MEKFEKRDPTYSILLGGGRYRLHAHSGGGRVGVTGDAKVADAGGIVADALLEAMRELDAARVVVAAVRSMGDAPLVDIRGSVVRVLRALVRHDNLTSDRSSPSDWASR
jgi:hypothetical protein